MSNLFDYNIHEINRHSNYNYGRPTTLADESQNYTIFTQLMRQLLSNYSGH